MNKPDSVAGANPPSGLTAVLLGVGAVMYTLLAAGCAAYLLYKAYVPGTTALSAFDQVAIAALISVVGTGLIGLATIYSATRQSVTAYQVAVYNGMISRSLNDMKEKSDASLAEIKKDLDASLLNLKAASDESLARLKIALDAGQIAHRELWGTATSYFHTLRSIALGKWDDDGLKASESSMIAAARHVIHVETEMRDQWFDFWQRAQDIYRKTSGESDTHKRPDILRELLSEKVAFSSGRLNLRDLHSRLEGTAKLAMEPPVATVPAAVGGVPV